MWLLLQTLLLVLAVSVDSFAASFAYGAGGIRIPPLSVLLVGGMCSLVLSLSLWLGSLLCPLLPPGLTVILSCALLFLLGAVKLFDGLLKARIRRRPVRRQLFFSAFNLHFILSVYADPEQADADRSKVLSPLEAVSLAAALSVDGLAAGFGAAIGGAAVWAAALGSLLVGCLAVWLGAWLGRKLSETLPFDLSWAGGLLLLLLAGSKLLV